MSSRRYLKRVWRVPKTRGPVECFASLLVKAMRKHGWPADWKPSGFDPSAFFILHKELGLDAPPDFCDAAAIAVRVLSRAHRVDVSELDLCVTFNRAYRVTLPGGHFKEYTE